MWPVLEGHCSHVASNRSSLFPCGQYKKFTVPMWPVLEVHCSHVASIRSSLFPCYQE
ncbi:hypothetical protein DPMN_121182 [Dreissena polymorpha]|uniref:Uncharacterized protein n=1 Tax=Dreissena polymorpha TaxID=45954 RepID=A0A9D4GMA8_DREPO|nr:hypothetical protein DPMN_121182 [Dreissena polymorpha]